MGERTAIAVGGRGRAVMPHSEVMIHMQVAGRVMSFVYLGPGRGVQLLDDTDREFSFPVNAGEAGIYLGDDGAYYYAPVPEAASD